MKALTQQIPVWFFRVLIGIVFATLASCATKPAPESGTQASAMADQKESGLSDGKIQEPTLPAVELNGDLLEQLLITNFAPYAGDLQLSASEAFKAAQTSKDHRLASYAAVTGLRIGNHQLAREAALLWRELVPESDSPQTTLILAYLGLGESKSAYEELLVRGEGQELDEQLAVAAQLVSAQGNHKAATEVMAYFVDDNPSLPDAFLSAAYVGENFRNYTAALDWIDVALELKPGWDRAAQLKASILNRQGKAEERKSFIESFLEDHPVSITMRMNHAADLAREKHFDQALELMQEVIKDDPDNVPALNYGAALAEHLKETQLAVDYYQSILKLESDNDEVRWSLARLALDENQFNKAEQYYEAISSERFYFRAQLQVANMRYENKGLKSALKKLNSLDPLSEQDYVDIATTKHYILMQEHQHEEAFSAINETLVFLPDNFELRYARSLVAAELGEVEAVEEDLRFVLNEQPDNADALNALGYTLADQTGRLEEAKDLIGKALELRPDAAHIIDSMGWVLYRLGELEQAREYLQQAYDMEPLAEIAAHLGEVLWELGEENAARAIWEEGLLDDAKNPVLIATMQRYGLSQGVIDALTMVKKDAS